MSQVVLTEKLIAYLKKKGACAILLDVAECKSCGGAIGELYARPCKRAEAERMLAENKPGQRAFSCMDERGAIATASRSATDGGGAAVQLIVARRTIQLEDEVRLDLQRVLGIPNIKVAGATF